MGDNMNKKGFTLIEALLVIAIIGVILLTLVPSIIVIINKNKENSYESMQKSILSAAKMYVAENKYNLGFNCNEEKSIPVSELIDNGLLKDNLVNPKTNEDITNTTSVKVTYNCAKKSFSYELILANKFTVTIIRNIDGDKTNVYSNQIISGQDTEEVTIDPLYNYTEFNRATCTNGQNIVVRKEYVGSKEFCYATVKNVTTDTECTVEIEK